MWQYGVSIPGDLSIVGFNDIFATRYMTPPLTTVGYDASKIGALGSQLVLQEINASDEKREPSVLIVKPKLYVRGSIAQEWRGIVGTQSCSPMCGYTKDYRYDKRLRFASPPYFPQWAKAQWAGTYTGEVAPQYR